MPVVTAQRVEASVQKDGRLAVREVHTSDAGAREERVYLAEPEADLDAMLEENSRAFLAKLAEAG